MSALPRSLVPMAGLPAPSAPWHMAHFALKVSAPDCAVANGGSIRASTKLNRAIRSNHLIVILFPFLTEATRMGQDIEKRRKTTAKVMYSPKALFAIPLLRPAGGKKRSLRGICRKTKPDRRLAPALQSYLNYLFT